MDLIWIRYVCVVHGWVDREQREIHKRIRCLDERQNYPRCGWMHEMNATDIRQFVCFSSLAYSNCLSTGLSPFDFHLSILHGRALCWHGILPESEAILIKFGVYYLRSRESLLGLPGFQIRSHTPLEPWIRRYFNVLFAVNLTSLAGWLFFMFQLLNLWPVKSFISSPQFCFSTESQSPPFFLAAVRLRALRRTDRHQAWQSHRWSIQKIVKLDQGITMSWKQRKAANLHLLLGVKGWTSLFSHDFPCHHCGHIPKPGELGSDGPFPVFWLQGHGGKTVKPAVIWSLGGTQEPQNPWTQVELDVKLVILTKQNLIWIWYEFMLVEWWW